MIYITVGVQLPFDRLISFIDRWAETNREEEIFAQIGAGTYVPRHFQFTDFVPADRARAFIESADIVVSHAGMGTIISRLTAGRPVIVVPREAALGEHRNDHQIQTARRLSTMPGVHTAHSYHELSTLLDKRALMSPTKSIGPLAGDEFISSLARFIDGRPE